MSVWHDVREELLAFALGLPEAREDHPWGDTVYKNAKGKIFLFLGEDESGATAATLKLTPDEGTAALTLPFVSVARYVGRFGWVSVRFTTEVERDIVLEWVQRSYDLLTPQPNPRRARASE
jgi:predicted DNA-binding protein (MmcQ/YjbR family)